MQNRNSSKNFRLPEIIATITFLCIILVQNYIRPAYTGNSSPMIFLLGVFPNLLAGFAMTVSVFLRIQNSEWLNRIAVKKRILVAALICFFGLLLWEFIQIIAQHPFDIYDIWASAAGALVAISILTVYTIKKPRSQS